MAYPLLKLLNAIAINDTCYTHRPLAMEERKHAEVLPKEEKNDFNRHTGYRARAN